MRWRLQPRAMEAATLRARSAFLAALLVLVPLCRAFSRRREWHNWHLKVTLALAPTLTLASTPTLAPTQP